MLTDVESKSEGSPSGEITLWLRSWQEGNDQALDHVMNLVMDTLHAMAQRLFLKESARHTLQPTALVNEVYLRLLREKRLQADNRVQFLGMIARKMRQILVDYARKKRFRSPQGNPNLTVSLESVGERPCLEEASVDVLALNEALLRLGRKAPRMAQIVEMRFFAGLTITETSLVLALSERTVYRDWLVAKSRLFQDLAPGRQGHE